MLRVSRQARILIQQRDSRVGSLSEFIEFPQSFRTRPNQSSENSVEPEWILTELPRSSYSEDSRQAAKSSGPQNLASLSTLQRLNLEAPWGGGLNLTFFTPSAGGSTVVFLGGVRRCSGQRLGMRDPLLRPAGHGTWPGHQVSSLHRLWVLDTLSTTSFGHVDKTVFRNTPTHCRPATPGSVGLVLCATSFPRVVFSMTMTYFGHNEDTHGFWSIWCFSVIRCS
jgi:hypothetical protein